MIFNLTRVDVELVLVLVGLELVGVAGDEDVAIQLTVQGGQGWKREKKSLNIL